MKNGNVYRQGDVLIIPTNMSPKRLPEGTTEEPRDQDGSLTLAYGEVTGHRHRFVREAQAEMFPLGRTGKVENARNVAQQAEEASLAIDRLLVLKKDEKLVHEEHDTVELPEGNYIVRIQKQYNPGRIVNVAD